MKILHSSDWHLGRFLHEHSLLEDQKAFLDFLISHIEEHKYRALIIAGDIYDRAVPAPEAVHLFSTFLGRMHQICPDTAICILSGNHDSPGRLGFAAELLQYQNIHLMTDPKKVDTPVVIKQNDETAHIYMIPFLFPGEYGFSVEGQRLSHEDSVRQAVDLIKEKLDTSVVNILAAHVFTTGAGSSDSERIFVGTAGQVSADLFSVFDYVALGHLHKPQKISDTIFYSGSPIAYSFSEADDKKQMLAISIEKSSVSNIDTISIPVFRSILRHEGKFQELLNGDDRIKNAYLDITLIGDELLINPMSRLQDIYPYLLCLRQNQFNDSGQDRRSGLNGSTGTDIIADFTAFYSHVCNSDVPDSVLDVVKQEAHEIEGVH